MNKYQMPYSTFTSLSGTETQFPENSVISSIDPNKVIGITILMNRLKNNQGLTLTEYAGQVAAKQAAVLTHQEFFNYFSVPQEYIDQIQLFAVHFGMNVVSENRGSASISLTAPVSVLNQAFNIDIKKITFNDQECFGHVEPISVPDDISHIVKYVLGLNSIVESKIRNSSNVVVNSFNSVNVEPYAVGGVELLTPLQVARTYNFPEVEGNGQCIGLVMYDGGYSKANVDLSFSAVGVTSPTIKDYSVNGGYNKQYTQSNPDLQNVSFEVALNIFVVGCLVPKATIVVYFDNDRTVDTNWIDPINAALMDTVNNPSVISISWGFPESQVPAILMEQFEEVMAQSVILGKTICCATGNNGSYANRVELSVNYPASSNYALAVGGTFLRLEDDGSGQRGAETGWQLSGGGISKYRPIPFWQEGLTFQTFNQKTKVVGPVQNLSDFGFRAIPDVSANAADLTGYTFYTFAYDSFFGTGQQYASYKISATGTSGAAPLIAALIIKLNQLAGKPLGFVNQTFYANNVGFTDIRLGENAGLPDVLPANSTQTGYYCTLFWDPVTGLGVPNGNTLYSIIAAAPYVDNILVTMYQNTSIVITPTVNAAVNKINIQTPPLYGTAEISSSSISIIYTPYQDFVGDDSIIFTVSTLFATSDPSLISIAVLRTTPIANTTTVIVVANSIDNVIVPNVTNFYDAVEIYSANSLVGSVTTSGSTFLYTPLINFVGTDTFQYTASSPSGTSNVGNIIVTIPKPAAPTAYSILRTVFYNSLDNIITPNVGNIFSSITAPVRSVNSGTVSVINNIIFYSPPRNFEGADDFSYTATGPGGTSTAKVFLTVLNSGSSILAYDVSQYVEENSVDNLIKLSNTNSDGVLSIIDLPDHGQAAVISNKIYYTPNTDYVGFDRFLYYITGSDGTTSSNAFVNISVNSLEYTPKVFKSIATVFENSTNNVLTPLVANTATSIAINTQPIFGSATVISSSTVSYTPNTFFSGLDYFYFSAANKAGISKPQKFYVKVIPQQIPVAFNTSTVVDYNSVNNIILPSVLFPFNTTTIATSPVYGIATASNTVIYYTPTQGYSGSDTFTYLVGNLKGISNTAQVDIRVRPSPSLIIYPPSGNLPKGSTGTSYNPVVFRGLNGTPPFTSQLTSGALPQSMTLQNNVLSGTIGPSTAGLYYIQVTVEDSSIPNKLSATGTYVLAISDSEDILITAESFNDLISTCTNLITTTYGAESTTRSVVAEEDLILALNWNLAYNDILRGFIHQNGTGTNVTYNKVSTGTFVSLGQLNSMKTTIRSLNSTFWYAHPSQILLDTSTVVSVSTTTPITKLFTVYYDWASSADARYFFNLGGRIEGVITNPDTSNELKAVFTLTNYNTSTRIISSGSQAVINGTGRIEMYKFIEDGLDSRVVAQFQITTSSNVVPAQIAFTSSVYYSTDITGGILAPLPTVQTSRVLFGSIGTVNVIGNDLRTLNITVSNGEDRSVTLRSDSIRYLDRDRILPLIVTYDALPLTLAPNTTSFFQIKLQNFTAIGGKYPTTFIVTIYLDDNTSETFTVVLPAVINVLFGITPVPSELVGITIRKPTEFNFTVTGYGDVLRRLLITNMDSPFSLTSSTFNTDQLPDAPVTATITVLFNPSGIINGPYTESFFIDATAAGSRIDKEIGVNLDIQVPDKNIGFWLSPQNKDNAVMGFSYDYFNGVRTLTMGFGSDPSLQDGGYPTYSSNSMKSLGRARYTGNIVSKRSANSSRGTFINTYGITSVDTNATVWTTLNLTGSPWLRVTDGAYVAFLNQYGVWNNSRTTALFNHTFTFNFAITGYYNFTGSCDDYGFVYLDEVTVLTITGYQSTYSASVYITAGNHSVRLRGVNTGGPGSFGLTIVATDLLQSDSREFFVRYTGACQWTFSATGSGSLTIDGTVVHTQTSGNPSSSVQGNLSLDAGIHTVSWNGIGTVAAKITHLGGINEGSDVWCTLDHSYRTSWFEMTRISLVEDGNTVDYVRPPNILANRGSTFASYFGDGNETKAMWTVTHFGDGELRIQINNLYTLSPNNSSINKTLKNASDVFYYYSGITDRLSQLSVREGSYTQYFLGFNADGTVITSQRIAPYAPPLDPPPPPAAGGGGGGDDEWWWWVPIFVIITQWLCFKKNTKVEMFDGTTKSIDNVEIGDYVYNHDRTAINQVRFVIKSKFTGKLYSPISSVEPFGSEHHPLILNNTLVSYDNSFVNNKAQWLGHCDQIDPVEIQDVKDIDVYNILVDGDGTYTVNGIGTTSVIGDGGAVIDCLEQGLIDQDQALDFLKYMHDQQSGKLILVWYKVNKLLAKIQNQYVFKLYAKVIKYILRMRNSHGTPNL